MREAIYGAPDKGRRVGFHILLIMLGQGDRVKMPGRRDPTLAGFGLFSVFPGCASSSALEMSSSSISDPPLAKESAGRRTPHATDRESAASASKAEPGHSSPCTQQLILQPSPFPHPEQAKVEWFVSIWNMPTLHISNGQSKPSLVQQCRDQDRSLWGAHLIHRTAEPSEATFLLLER